LRGRAFEARYPMRQSVLLAGRASESVHVLP
jgi:hypothetical protein